MMNWIRQGIRSALFMISGTGSTLILATALFGVWLAWNCGTHPF